MSNHVILKASQIGIIPGSALPASYPAVPATPAPGLSISYSGPDISSATLLLTFPSGRTMRPTSLAAAALEAGTTPWAMLGALIALVPGTPDQVHLVFPPPPPPVPTPLPIEAGITPGWFGLQFTVPDPTVITLPSNILFSSLTISQPNPALQGDPSAAPPVLSALAKASTDFPAGRAVVMPDLGQLAAFCGIAPLALLAAVAGGAGVTWQATS